MTKIKSLIEKINKGNNPLFIELYGSETETLKQQANRYEILMEDFEKTFGTDDVMLFSSPGRTEIGGNHTDHNFGRVLAGAVNLDNIAVAEANGSNIIRIKSAGYPEFQVDLSELNIDERQFYTSGSLVKGICAKMKAHGYKMGGFNACIDGRVPKGSGLSSSASFEVLIGTILNHLFNGGK